jgi:beta-galactosidase
MRSFKFVILAVFVYISLFIPAAHGQVLIKELSNYNLDFNKASFFGASRTRYFIPLNGIWTAGKYNGKEKSNISVPSGFNAKGEYVFEKYFSLTQEQVENHKLKLNFLGINYSADISLNNIIIYQHTGGNFPFSIDLPKDILSYKKSNILSVKLNYNIDAENTIPVKQRFLFPSELGGIFRDVYIQVMPSVVISDFNYSYQMSDNLGKARVWVNTRIENGSGRQKFDSSSSANDFTLRFSVVSPSGQGTIASETVSFNISKNKEKQVSHSFDVTSPSLWSTTNPNSYILRIELYKGDVLIDAANNSISFYSASAKKDGFYFNGSPFALKGVTYFPSNGQYGTMQSYEKMEEDLRLIKELGFNAVRFPKSLPHPYYLELCEKMGLLAYVDLPFHSIPGKILTSANFMARSRTFVAQFIKSYHNYSAIAAIGIGSSFIGNYPAHENFISEMSRLVKDELHKNTYASFANEEINEIEGLDLYGIELFNTSVADDENIEKLQSKLGAGRVFLSEATYVANLGASNGYTNQHSFEAQAKYYNDLIDYAEENTLNGYFINTMFDYRGMYASVLAGYDADRVYKIGILGEDHQTDRLAYKVIYSKLHNTEKVTIPIGSKKDEAPMVFILFGLAIALLLGILFNSGRKFREDSLRALLRPYNFYSDIRDMRIMSSIYTTFLAFICSAISALLLSNLLFYFKGTIMLEKVLLSFGSDKLMAVFSYLAWHPVASLIWLTVVSFAAMIAITVVVKGVSFFVRIRVYLITSFYAVIWSFLPLTLLIPLGLVLFRLLNTNIANMYIFIGLALFTVWICYRMIKGIYVIFDVSASKVYFYGTVLIIAVLGGLLFYYQMSSSTIDYLLYYLKQS